MTARIVLSAEVRGFWGWVGTVGVGGFWASGCGDFEAVLGVGLRWSRRRPGRTRGILTTMINIEVNK